MTTRAYRPRTDALRRVLDSTFDERLKSDLIYLESWEAEPSPGAGAALRVNQLRRANPMLAAEIRAELTKRRPLTEEERAVLLARNTPSAPPRRASARKAELRLV